MTVFPAPMQAPQRLYAPFTDPEWVYELKHDGYRCLAGVGGGQVQLRTKTLRDCSDAYPEVIEALAKLPGGPHVLDGEVCVIGPDGVSDFNRFHAERANRKPKRGAPPVTFCAFDLLTLDGRSLMARSLESRKAKLKALLEGVPKVAVLFVDDLPADADLFRAMVLAGLPIEGVVAKRRASHYQPGVRSDDWRKIKRPGWQEGRNWTA